jgi:hypothetical protein
MSGVVDKFGYTIYNCPPTTRSSKPLLSYSNPKYRFNLSNSDEQSAHQEVLERETGISLKDATEFRLPQHVRSALAQARQQQAGRPASELVVEVYGSRFQSSGDELNLDSPKKVDAPKPVERILGSSNTPVNFSDSPYAPLPRIVISDARNREINPSFSA